MVCIWLLTTNGFAQNTIKGDGNIITKEISISDYDEISYVGKVNIEYEQSNASPFFKITIDENILPHLDIKIKGKTLIIQPKDEKKYFNGNSYGLNLQPTVCEIKTSSRELKEISAVGGGEFIAKSPLKADKLDISIAGSSTINFDKQLEARKINFSVAGSGDINATQLKVDNLDCSVAGSGSILLKGGRKRRSERSWRWGYQCFRMCPSESGMQRSRWRRHRSTCVRTTGCQYSRRWPYTI